MILNIESAPGSDIGEEIQAVVPFELSTRSRPLCAAASTNLGATLMGLIAPAEMVPRRGISIVISPTSSSISATSRALASSIDTPAQYQVQNITPRRDLQERVASWLRRAPPRETSGGPDMCPRNRTAAPPWLTCSRGVAS